MEAIRQNGKIILHSNDGISIKMIFRNLTGRNFQGQEYAVIAAEWMYHPYHFEMYQS